MTFQRPPSSIGRTGEANKLVLCRPVGGLNDVLCQIEKCWQYCQANQRSLIIDLHHNPFMRRVFEMVEFQPSPFEIVVNPNRAVLERLKAESTYPKEVQGRLNSYKPSRVATRNRSEFYDSDSRVRLTFDFRKSYSETVLLHHSGGGGSLSFSSVQRLSLPLSVHREVSGLLAHLPGSYSACHVRATDLQTDFKRFLSTVLRRSKGSPMLLCTDNEKVRDHAKSLWPEGSLFTIGSHEAAQGEPIHRTPLIFDPDTARAEAFSLLAELAAVSRARKFYYTSILDSGATHRPKFSGLSLLMAFLARNPDKSPFPANVAIRGRGRVIYLDSFWAKLKLAIFQSTRTIRSSRRRFVRASRRSNMIP